MRWSAVRSIDWCDVGSREGGSPARSIEGIMSITNRLPRVPDDATELSHERTDLSVERTYLAYDRTLMAWTRTAASLISVGFAIYKFFHELGERRPPRILGYVTFSLLMMSTGMVALLLATIQHRRDTRQLEADYHGKPRYLALV